jgi:curli production assembly/transport component CsgF
MSNKIWMVAAAATLSTLGALGSIAAASASGIVYHPVNPTFGGNPLNGSTLLSTAQAQGNGVKSGSQGPDLSGLSNALSGIGGASTPVVVVGGSSIPTNP